MHQWASALVGATAAKIVGGDAITGASTAASGTKNNFLTHWQEIQRQLAIDNKDWDKVAYWDAIDKAQNQACNELNIDFQSLPKGYWEDPQNAGLLERIAVRGQELEADPSYQNSFMLWKDREDWKAAAQQLERRGVSTDDPTYYNQLTAEYDIASEQSTNVLLFAGGESFSAIKAATEFINARSVTIAAGAATGKTTTSIADDVVTLAENPWTQGPVTRGTIIDDALGNNLGRTFPTVDKLENGILTSTKSLDVTAQTYQTEAGLFGRVKADIDSLAQFTSGQRNGIQVLQENYNSKVFELALPDATLSAEQMNAINEAKQYAAQLGIGFKIVVVK